MTPPQQPPPLKSEPRALGPSAPSYSSFGEWAWRGGGGIAFFLKKLTFLGLHPWHVEILRLGV
uniref:Uncharacterized protein n=1 Tax=Sus scrofa TaxID=9823 RepID=A0A8D0N2J3_PIG